jgi:DNA-binding CsgD family transcriptional regulator
MSVPAEPAATVLARWFSAFNAHDIEGVLAVAHPSIEIVPLGVATTSPPGTTYHGHEGVRSLMLPGFHMFPQLRIRPGEPEAVGDCVVVPVAFDLDDGSVSSIRRAIGLFRLEDGLIRRLNAFDTRAEADRFLGRRSAAQLSPREREVLALLAEGLHADEVADRLVISPLTVRSHVRNAKDKLGARTSGQAIAMAIRDGV